MASPISKEQAEHRESGFQRGGEMGADGGAVEATIRAHNQELDARVGGHLELPIVVLAEQRDQALRRLATLEQRADAERRRLVAEQDKFISYLMSEHEAKLEVLQRELRRSRAASEQLQAISKGALSSERSSGSEAGEAATQLTTQLEYLRQSLEGATQEIEETRADAGRLQEERDEAIRGMDDIRLELMGEIDAARDESFQLETRLDEARRALEDAQDQLRDEASRFNEDLGELQRELDERNAEVRRLRARLATHVTEVKASHPPPPEAAKELERARRETQQLRQQLIEAKRQLAMRPGGVTTARSAPRQALSPGLPTTQPFDPKAPARSITPLNFGGPPTKRG